MVGDEPNLFQLRRLAKASGYLLVASSGSAVDPDGRKLYALVVPDFWGSGSDPDGNRAAEAAFDGDGGMTLAEIAAQLVP